MQSENIRESQADTSDDLNLLVGQTLGEKFRIVERIGAGGMAMVFKAHQSTLDRYVAIKVLPAHCARDPIFVKRFVQEARSVAKLAHPNIVQIHDFGEQANITYIVMEYVDGGTLKDRLKRVLPPAEAIDFVMQAAEGLHCAHCNGIVHRDVKPANMLIRRDGHLLLSDFGIAKILEGTMNLTRAGTGIGTPQYMSPEQSMGQATVDRRSDIYSLGIVLFHCLTGRVPFTGDSPISITLKQVNEPLPIEKLTVSGVPKPIVETVQRMTAKQPQERYQTAEEVVQALNDALSASKLARWHRSGSSGPIPKLVPANTPPQDGRSVPSPTCFRCGTLNANSRRYCTTCGYDLANPRTNVDTYLVNGRPILARLTLRSGPMTGRSYRFHQDETTIGRTNGNDLIISGRTVSRRHARLTFSKGNWYIEDTNSQNGTFVNSVRTVQKTLLHKDDVINFGDEIVVFDVTYGP